MLVVFRLITTGVSLNNVVQQKFIKYKAGTWKILRWTKENQFFHFPGRINLNLRCWTHAVNLKRHEQFQQCHAPRERHGARVADKKIVGCPLPQRFLFFMRIP